MNWICTWDKINSVKAILWPWILFEFLKVRRRLVEVEKDNNDSMNYFFRIVVLLLYKPVMFIRNRFPKTMFVSYIGSGHAAGDGPCLLYVTLQLYISQTSFFRSSLNFLLLFQIKETFPDSIRFINLFNVSYLLNT